MYNRYIPQSDGSYSRKTMGERSKPAQQPVKTESQESPAPVKTPPASSPVHPGSNTVPSFLRQLLPKEFDTGDLLIILLLLLMAGDCEDERNNALLTLALYFFM